MKNPLFVIAAGLLLFPFLHAAERPLVYPFDVTLGGNKAEMKAHNDIFAVIPKPVAADAVLAIDKKVPMLIINAFACKEDGTVEENHAAAIIFAQDVSEVKLDATMDQKKLPPGNYLANVVADGKTSRIVFTVAGPDAKPAMDFSKILSFLKKKAGQE